MKRRLDILLVERGLVESRTRAQALVMEGKVRVAGQTEYKASRQVDGETPVEIESPPRFVSRGGEKLEGAFELWGTALGAEGKTCLDVGSSTGGFTDCLLQHGARRVMAVDVGTTKSKGDDGDASEVFAIENVREGEHTLVLKCEGYADATKHPVVENRKTQTVNVRLKRVFTPNVEITTDSGVHRGVLISNTANGVEVEVSLGINRTFPHSEIRKIEFIK